MDFMRMMEWMEEEWKWKRERKWNGIRFSGRNGWNGMEWKEVRLSGTPAQSESQPCWCRSACPSKRNVKSVSVAKEQMISLSPIGEGDNDE